ncbi:MAG: GGDEF domain-containing protein [Sulfuricellaceae bacterium]|nr:GGDEF domain-containing protein [Sulfuricellaceae bacterium]
MKRSWTELSALDIFLAIHAGFSILMVASISIGILRDTQDEVERSQHDATFSVKAAVQILSVEIRSYRQMAALLVQEKRDFLGSVLSAPDPDAHLFDLAQILETWFPKTLAFTLADAKGVPVVSDFKGSIGPVCLEDMRQSISQHRQMVPLHGMSSIPHYDITAPINDRGVLLLSFTTQSLQSFLDQNRDTRYELGYAKSDAGMDELLSKAPGQHVTGETIEGSDIHIYARLIPDYLASVQRQKWQRLFGYSGGVLLFSILVGGVLWGQRSRIVRHTSNIQSLNLELQRLSQLDPLTGLANRRGLDEYFGRILAQARRENKSFCLAMFDIDYFKRINDELGHQQGDVCLNRIGSLLAEQAKRPMDIAVRYGGEEFLMCWYDVDLEQAVQLAEAIRQQVRFAFCQADGSPLTLSVGLCQWPDPSSETQSWDELVRRADEALYRAKQNGRDRLEIG